MTRFWEALSLFAAIGAVGGLVTVAVAGAWWWAPL